MEIYKVIDVLFFLRNKKDLILNFIDLLRVDVFVIDEWKVYINNKKKEEFDKII